MGVSSSRYPCHARRFIKACHNLRNSPVTNSGSELNCDNNILVTFESELLLVTSHNPKASLGKVYLRVIVIPELFSAAAETHH
jgi:hypothetical protein